MTGNEWMFYLALVGLFITFATYTGMRIWIEVRKRKIRDDMK